MGTLLLRIIKNGATQAAFGYEQLYAMEPRQPGSRQAVQQPKASCRWFPILPNLGELGAACGSR
jgi:hypothetical protein